MGLEIHSFLFTSDHGILKQGPDNFASNGLETYSPRGFLWNNGLNPIANPVSHTRNLSVNVTYSHKVTPSGIPYDLIGAQTQWAFSFLSTGHLSGTGVIPTDDISDAALPNYVARRDYNPMSWTSFNIGNGNASTIGNVIFITWATPLEVPTRKRLEWACDKAEWTSTAPPQTEENVADAIWDALKEDPPLEPPYAETDPAKKKKVLEGATWRLLDGDVSGECDEQANLMRRAMNIVGITATVHLIRASHNTAVVFDQESMLIDGRIAYLIMDFEVNGSPEPADSFAWNAFEGCCTTANKWYAVFPPMKEATAIDMFHELSFEQFWVYTVGNKVPGNGALEVEAVANPNVIPKLP
ncbi:MAG: hypothetical protein M3R13_05975 [Armatimonadota bacterium]|nr:hypothetical protein [Armatimonadota bacterium]